VAVFTDWPWVAPGDGVAPWRVLPLVYGPHEHPWPSAGLILGNAYVLAGLVLFGAMIAGNAELIVSRVGSSALDS
jgi:hypothetical protein